VQTCRANTRAGTPCRAPAGPEGLCFFHANPDKAHVLGQVGGRKNRHQLPEPPSAGPLNAADLSNILAEAIRDVRSKKITPRAASAISQLCNSLHRVTPTAELEARVARLEHQLAEQQSTAGDPSGLETNGTATAHEEDTQQDIEQGRSAAPDTCQPVVMGTENESVEGGDGTDDEEGE